MTYLDKRRYEGYFRNNMYNGKGLLTFADGSSYEGDFKNGLYWGYGV